MRGNGVLCGLGGVLAVVLFVTFMAFNSRPVEAQAPPGVPNSGYAVSPQPAPVNPTPAPGSPMPAPVANPAPPVDPAIVQAAAAAVASPSAAPTPTDVAPPPTGGGPIPAAPPQYTTLQQLANTAIVPSPGIDRLRTESIEDLLNRLKAVKVQKAELERSELELVALLKEKIREQKVQMQTLGIAVEESHAAGHGLRPAIQR